MKKTLIGLVISMFWFASASADVGARIGVTGNAGLYAATATELDTGSHGTTTDFDESQTQSEYLGLVYGSVFAEVGFGPVFVGVDYMPGSIDTEETSTTVGDKTTTDTSTDVTNKVSVEFENLTNFYAGVRILESFFIKAGSLSVDLNTKESLGTGSSYDNTSVDGSMMAVGMDKVLDNGMFFRVEGQYSEFDSASLTSSSGSQKITMESLDGVVAKLSVGKAF